MLYSLNIDEAGHAVRLRKYTSGGVSIGPHKQNFWNMAWSNRKLFCKNKHETKRHAHDILFYTHFDRLIKGGRRDRVTDF